jgi:hypothetical protein
MNPAWIFAIFVSIFSITLLSLLFWAVRRERREWAAKMEAIERKYTAALCESKARHARFKMRIRAVKRKLEEMLRNHP